MDTSAYMYIDCPLNSQLVIKNLKHNAKKYVEFQHWGSVKSSAFYKALELYIDGIKEGRMSTLMDGRIQDSKGSLGNGEPWWFDKDGYYISVAQYQALSSRKKKKCHVFYPNREVASYMETIISAIYKNKIKEEEEKQKKEKEQNLINSFRNSGIR